MGHGRDSWCDRIPDALGRWDRSRIARANPVGRTAYFPSAEGAVEERALGLGCRCRRRGVGRWRGLVSGQQPGVRRRLVVRDWLAAVAHHLFEPRHHPLRGRVLRVDGQRPPGEQVRPGLVAALERDPRQPDDRDRVARVGVGDLAVEGLGRVDPADPSARSASSSSSITRRPPSMPCASSSRRRAGR